MLLWIGVDVSSIFRKALKIINKKFYPDVIILNFNDYYVK